MAKKFTSWGWIDREIDAASHWGVLIDLNKPVTGVVGNNRVEWLDDEMVNGIDLAWEEHSAECTEEDHDQCGPDQRGDTLIGKWHKGDDGLWAPDESGEYSAIVREFNTQVVWSKHTKRCAPCSPCYPGQADLNSPSDTGLLCFDLPPELYGDRDQ